MRKLAEFSQPDVGFSRAPRPDDTVVYIHGDFDIFHIGYAHVLKAAKELGGEERTARRRRGRRRGGIDVDAEADVSDVAAGGELPDAEAVAAPDARQLLEAGAEDPQVVDGGEDGGGRELQQHAAALADERHRAAQQDGDDRERGERVGERAGEAGRLTHQPPPAGND